MKRVSTVKPSQKNKNGLYPRELKEKVLDMLTTSTVSKVAKEMGLSEKTLYGWQYAHRKKTGTVKSAKRTSNGKHTPNGKPAPSVLHLSSPALVANVAKTIKSINKDSDFARGVAFGSALHQMQTLLIAYQREPQMQTARGTDNFVEQMRGLLDMVEQ